MKNSGELTKHIIFIYHKSLETNVTSAIYRSHLNKDLYRDIRWKISLDFI